MLQIFVRLHSGFFVIRGRQVLRKQNRLAREHAQSVQGCQPEEKTVSTWPRHCHFLQCATMTDVAQKRPSGGGDEEESKVLLRLPPPSQRRTQLTFFFVINQIHSVGARLDGAMKMQRCPSPVCPLRCLPTCRLPNKRALLVRGCEEQEGGLTWGSFFFFGNSAVETGGDLAQTAYWRCCPARE